MSSTEMVPAEVTGALAEWAAALHRMHEPLTVEAVTSAWIGGLVAARIKAEHAKVPGGKYPRRVPLALEFPCPFGHRTADQYDRARVRLIINDNGWPMLDPASPCQECTHHALEQYLLGCPLCAAGVDREDHYPDHDLLDVLASYDFTDGGLPKDYDDIHGGFDASPVAWVMREFVRLTQIALARWWLDHTEEAILAIPRLERTSERDRERFVSERLAWARGVLDAAPKSKAGNLTIEAPKKPSMTPEQAADWLDSEGLPVKGQTATWNAAKDLPGCPPQSVVFAAASIRRGRATAT